MKYRDLDIGFDEILLIHENQLLEYRDCVVLDVLTEQIPTSMYADVGICGATPVKGDAPSFMTNTRFLVGRTKAGKALFGENSN